MESHIAVDPESDTPIYVQIAQRVEDGIAADRLRAGSRLPTIRDLAAELSVTRVTVHKAYLLLQQRGFVDSTVGRGTFVTEDAPRRLAASVLRHQPASGFLHESDLAREGIVSSLAIAEPEPEVAPAREFIALDRKIEHDASFLSRYGAVEGEPRLRHQITELLERRGIRCAADDLIITAGSSLALAALVEQMTRPGDRVLVERSTYFGLLSLLQDARVEAIPVAIDKDGILPEELERAVLRERPRFLYTIPTFHNPTGITMTSERRLAVISIAERYGLRIVEDDVFHLLSYDGEAPPPLRALAPEADITYVDSFSKALLPGLRIGYVLAPRIERSSLAGRLQRTTVGGPLLLQHTLAEFLERGLLDRHLEKALPIYRRRRDALMAALEQKMPETVHWTRPAGGFCCWLDLPSGPTFRNLALEATRYGVGCMPSQIFDPERQELNHLRLCFGAAEQDLIEASVRVLGHLIREASMTDHGEREPTASTRPLL